MMENFKLKFSGERTLRRGKPLPNQGAKTIQTADSCNQCSRAGDERDGKHC